MLHVLTNLIELDVMATGSMGLSASETLFFDGVALSQLQSLKFCNVSFSWDAISSRGLIALVIMNSIVSPGGSILDILQANPMLEKVVLEVPLAQSRAPPITTFSLFRLTHLELMHTPGWDFHDISMPSLRILRLCFVDRGVDELLQSLLDQGPVVLTELSIQGSPITTSKLISLLEESSSLESFELALVDGHADVVAEALANISPLLPSSKVTNAALNESSRPTIICPSLKHVTLSGCPDLTSGTIMRLVKSRLPRDNPEPQLMLDSTTANDRATAGVAQIETLVMDKCSGIEPEILPWLRSKVRSVSCVYATRKAARWNR